VALARCGAFDTFGRPRPVLLWEIELRAAAARAAAGDASGAADAAPLAAGGTTADALVAKLPGLADYGPQQRRRAELDVLEMTLDAHPFALFASPLERVRRLRPITPSDALRRREGEEVYLLGWKVTAKRTSTVNDEPMCFVTFCDETGRFEASFFPEVYARYALELVRGMGPFLIKGRVEVTLGAVEVVASHLKLLPPA
jgi:error-prone DNA polymerase